ncbi:MAG: PepSY-associated TM helix domain-containing protein [Tardiphaga sp.]
MTRSALRKWFWIHKWTSLPCTAFLLLICVTGLPLVFHDEIDDLLDNAPPYASVPAGAPRVSIDSVVDASRKLYPGEAVLFTFVDDDEPRIVVTMGPSWEAFAENRKSAHWIRFDAHTGQVLKRNRPFNADGIGFSELMLRLHRDLFAGLPGDLFMGFMGLLFVVATVSGIVVYGPFMRKLDFGTVRADRSRRIKWLDLHNMLGVVTLAWLLVVGVTGVINELSTPLFGLWQQTEVKAMLAPLRGTPTPSTAEMSSPQAAFDKVNAELPEMTGTSIIFPGSPFGSPYHYLIWTKGRTALTSRLFSPALVDARNGQFDGAVAMPWYLRALQVSRPLHFGDYGGMPLKIIWALLDLVTIAVLGSGLYLWLSRKSFTRVPEADSELAASNNAARSALTPGAAE